jgi:hypothetical protein
MVTFRETRFRSSRGNGLSFQQIDTYQQETKVLSPHEFATLMLVKDAPEQLALDRADLDILLEHQLVALETLPSGRQRPQITSDGVSILKAVARFG